MGSRQIVVDERFEHFKRPNVVILFELIEFGPHIPTNKYQARPALPCPASRLLASLVTIPAATLRAEACARNRIATVSVEALQ